MPKEKVLFMKIKAKKRFAIAEDEKKYKAFSYRLYEILVNILNNLISIWLPMFGLIFTIFYVSVAYYVYNYPKLNHLLLCD